MLRERRGNTAATSFRAWARVKVGVFFYNEAAIAAKNEVQEKHISYDDARQAMSDVRSGPCQSGLFPPENIVQ